MRSFLVRLQRTVAELLNPHRSLRLAVLEVALDLQRLDHRLFEILESLSRPLNVGEMREERTPRTVLAEIHRIGWMLARIFGRLSKDDLEEQALVVQP